MQYDETYIMNKYKIKKLTKDDLIYIEEFKLKTRNNNKRLKKCIITMFIVNFVSIYPKQNFLNNFLYLITMVVLLLYMCKLYYLKIVSKKTLLKKMGLKNF